MYKKAEHSWLKHLDFTIVDILAQELALLVAYLVRFHGFDSVRELIGITDGKGVVTVMETGALYARMAVVIFLIDVAVVFFTESYTGILRRNKYQELRHTIMHCAIVFGGFLVYLYGTQQSLFYSRTLLFVYFGTSIVVEYGGRVLLKRAVRWRKLQDKNKNRMIIVAESSNVDRCVSEIAHNRMVDFKVVGICIVDENRIGEEIQGIPVIAAADTFLDYIRTEVVDEVYIDGNTRASSEALAATLVELGLVVHISLMHSEHMVPNRTLENYGNYVVMTTSMHIANQRQLAMKRLMDIVGSIVGLVICGIAFVIFAPIIKLQSPGPVFFSQIRIGKNGRRFRFYKFRSMRVDAEAQKAELAEKNEMQGNMFKLEDDPRVIPIGRFMRKFSIDELPQFWNVLKGDMSLVGTRPPTEDEFEQYEYHHKARLAFRPGLTGMWQVSGRSDITDFEAVVALDTEYIAEWSLGLDIRILLKTIAVVLMGKGSK